MRDELRRVLPVFFNGMPATSYRVTRYHPLNLATGPPVNTPFSKTQVHELLSATKYEQVSVLMGWFWRQVVEPFLAR